MTCTGMECVQHPYVLVMVLICVEFMDQNGLSATPILARGAVYSLTTCTGLKCGQHPYMITMVDHIWIREPSAFISTSGTHLHPMHILRYH
jgi:hypothetical protein